MKHENDDYLSMVQKRKLKEMIDKLSCVLTQEDFHDIIMIFDKAIDRRIEEIKNNNKNEFFAT